MEGSSLEANCCLLSLGSNMGERLAALREGVERLARREVAPLAASSVYETEPVEGAVGQRPFYNACLLARSELSPGQLLAACKEVERELGRRDGPRHSPRPLDIDILLIGAQQLELTGLEVPHRQLSRRRFVLIPALELCPNLVLPGGSSLAQALADLPPWGEGVVFAHPPTALLDGDAAGR